MSNTARNALALLREQGHTKKRAEMKLAAAAYHKIHDGEGISDEELRCGIKVIGEITEYLKEVNDRKLDLFENLLQHDLDILEGYRAARRNRA